MGNIERVDSRTDGATEHLETALQSATDEDARIHIRQALQLLHHE